MKKILQLSCLALVVLAASCSTSPVPAESGSSVDTVSVKPMPQGFVAQKGVNIAHWLSQVFGWSPRATFFTRADVALLDSLGFDHIRLPIDEDQLWTPEGKPIPEAFDYLKQSIEWCKEYNIRVIIDLHILRSHHFNSNNGEGKMTLWTDSLAQNKFLGLWVDLQNVLHTYPVDFLAYELLNEPTAPDPAQWNKLIASGVAQIRKTEPNRVIFIGANQWQSIAFVPKLEVPAGDSNLVIAFHNYDPMLVTHHLASWTGFKQYTGRVQYPGLSADRKELFSQLDSTNPKVMEEINRINKVFNLQVCDSLISIVIKKGKQLNLSVYCGEFGCLNNVDTATRYHYYRDFVGTLNKYNIGFAHWDYKGAFNIVGYDTVKKQNVPGMDTVLIGILTKK